MFAKRGFTLIEILFVLIIMAGIVAYAVPSFKRARERSQYQAAVGILMDIHQAIAAFKQQYPSVAGFPFNSTHYYAMFTGSGFWEIAAIDEGERPDHYVLYKSPESKKDWRFNAMLLLLKYMEITAGTNTYNFYALGSAFDGSNSDICQGKCADGSDEATVCMCQSSTADGSGCFYGANMFADGRIVRFAADGASCGD